jgi:hypothetical protein
VASKVFNPPPNWPAPPPGWVPSPGWSPDPSWGPPPPGWDVWVRQHRPWYRRKRFIPLWLLLALIALGLAVGDGEDAARPFVASPAPATLNPGPDAEPARVAAEQEAARQAEAARVAVEQEAARVAAEQEAARVAAEQEAARQAEAARVAAEQEAARVAAEQAAEEEAGSSVYYENCTAVRAAGAAPIRRGDPGYARHLDRDGDGQGCAGE